MKQGLSKMARKVHTSHGIERLRTRKIIVATETIDDVPHEYVVTVQEYVLTIFGVPSVAVNAALMGFTVGALSIGVFVFLNGWI